MAQNKRGPQQVRIIGGKFKGRKLRFEGGAELRPTLGRTRETLFNWLRGSVPGARCLDLFAGSGVLGIEALSQGAAHVTFVERHGKTRRSLQSALEALELTDHSSVIGGDALRVLQHCETTFDIAFLDPPYAHPELLEGAISRLIERSLVTHSIYAETPQRYDLQRLSELTGWQLVKQTRAGDTTAALLQPN